MKKYYNYIKKHPTLEKIFLNIGWLTADKIIRMGLGLLVGAWIARYLGPENYGILNYALAFTGLFGAIAALGLPSIVVRDLVKEPMYARVTLGTAAVIHLMSSLLAYLLLIILIFYFKKNDYNTKVIVTILGLVLLFKTFEIANYWFEAQVKSKYIVWVQNSILIIYAFIKGVLIINEASLIAFAWANVAEAANASIILLWVVNKKAIKLKTLYFTNARAKEMLKDSWPLMLSGITIWIYMRVDLIMLGHILNNDSIGIYSAATRISEIWYFVPSMIVASVFPYIIEAKKKNENEYNEKIQKLYNLMTLISIGIAIPMTLLSPYLIDILYGKSYLEAGKILAVHIWTSVFVFLGIASNNYLIIENKQMISLQRAIFGAIINVGLNFILIKKYGALGAAYSTLIAQACASLFFDYFQKSTRRMFWMKIRSMNPLEWKEVFRIKF